MVAEVLRDDPGVAVEVGRSLGDGAVADAVVVAAREQRSAGRRADRRGVERVVADALARSAERRRVDLAAERVGQAEADVVDQHDEDIGRVLEQVTFFVPPGHVRSRLDRRPGDAGGRSRRERQHRSVRRPRFCGKARVATQQDGQRGERERSPNRHGRLPFVITQSWPRPPRVATALVRPGHVPVFDILSKAAIREHGARRQTRSPSTPWHFRGTAHD